MVPPTGDLKLGGESGKGKNEEASLSTGLSETDKPL
jgi:hypothetical protein